MRQQFIPSVLLCAMLGLPWAAAYFEKEQAVADLQAAPALRVIEEVRIGSSSDPGIGFTRISTVAVDRDGQVYAFEAQDQQIRVYSSTGRLVRTIGRRGDGPGEFSRGARFGIQGDTIWAYESQGAQGNLALFQRSDGAFLWATRFDPPLVRGRLATSLMLSPGDMRAEGTFISGGTYITTVMRGARPGGIGPTDTLRIPRLLFNAAGSVIDTVDWLVQAPPRPSEPLRYLTTSGSRHRVPKPFPDDDLSALFAEGGVTVVRHTAPNAARSTIRVTRQTLRGDTVFSRSYSYLPQGYPDALLDSLAAASLSSSAYAVIDGAVQQMIPDTTRAGQLAMRQAMSLSGNQPPVQTVHIGADASIWLEREDRGGATQRWDLLDARGTAVGRLELPRAMRIGWATQDQVWGILTDEDDVPWLVKLRVSR